jgi:hypothetical protein
MYTEPIFTVQIVAVTVTFIAVVTALLALDRWLMRRWSLRARRVDVHTPSGRPEREPCPACLARCSECDGLSLVICRRCGGAGEIVMEEILCPDCHGEARKQRLANPAQAAPICRACMDVGKIVSQKMECPVCKGVKHQTCPLCRGTGQESTGRVNAGRPEHYSYEQLRWHERAPVCPECQGNTFRSKPKEMSNV